MYLYTLYKYVDIKPVDKEAHRASACDADAVGWVLNVWLNGCVLL